MDANVVLWIYTIGLGLGLGCSRPDYAWSLQSYCGWQAPTMFGALSLTGSGSKQSLPPSKSSPKPRPTTQAAQPTITANPLSRVAISLEYASLRYQSHCPLGMYVVPLIGDPSIWDAVLFIHQGKPCPVRHPFAN